ncbi:MULTISPECIES: 4-(cytidine 5'-diphospho)-2-C-methyl-D-erythritol kinase [unclassified Coleofasciculus]|uniref:4-(cytidine 5'-diphospho)-2-C-methyl-D-erythritol kinase n=1 Tax=unclassified Coleofasciculus TaxID=2692782 RepID=UPI00187EE495|nr:MULTISPECIES: 4-(cytidine 5'-diphospho)-2-C-methyl-D-erythritol kinase [unclassified Coleofasciculus]MBE9130224.1 4-(cytidine 5'-diphospho)-2-C-methyl-D-erythritol kinase [Coleofasciculus sp. LEGE 07081]MBE9152525.1 4-(cytidine 5'-diphospho)-2-C-methyl-D-erythritol kinase [Coleofasciculus sp. LEGE 07092]
MRSYSLIAPAKINLYLEILSDRSDGYHELAMILQSIELGDLIELRASSTQTIHIHCDNPLVPPNQGNLAYRAAELMIEQFPGRFAQFGGVEITIKKQIPVAAGLAGGSTDAAAVLVGLDMIWQLGLTQPELQELASQLGSDVPFCIAGGTALATRRGEVLSPLPDLDSLYVVLAKHRNLSVSTAWAYQTYRDQFSDSYIRDVDTLESRTHRVHSGSMVQAITNKDSSQIGQRLYNDLEKVVLPNYPEVLQLRDAFRVSGVLGTMMSGSGPTVFALCESEVQAQEVQQQVRAAILDPELEFWVTRFSNHGIQIVSSVS